MTKKVHHYITKEGLAKLRGELEYLKTVKAVEIAARLKEAISYGDLRENSEYQSAREEELLLEARMREIEQQISEAEVVSTKKKRTSIIELGSVVTVKNLAENEEITFTIVGSTEMDPLNYKFSNEGPLGEAVLGKVKGDVVKFKAPKGEEEYEILAVA